MTNLIIAPHQDDEILGCSAVLEKSFILCHATNGVPPSKRSNDKHILNLSNLRYTESQNALSKLNVKPKKWIRFDFDDLSLSNVLVNLSEKIHDLIKQENISKIYIPAYQMGHPDHDAVFISVFELEVKNLLQCDVIVYSLYGLSKENPQVFGWIDNKFYTDIKYEPIPYKKK